MTLLEKGVKAADPGTETLVGARSSCAELLAAGSAER